MLTFVLEVIAFVSVIVVLCFWMVRKNKGDNIFNYAYCGEEDKILALLDKGYDINSRDEDGRTALHCAIDGSERATAAFLLKKGADVQIEDSAGRTPLLVVLAIRPLILRQDSLGWQRLRDELQAQSSFSYIKTEKVHCVSNDA